MLKSIIPVDAVILLNCGGGAKRCAGNSRRCGKNTIFDAAKIKTTVNYLFYVQMVAMAIANMFVKWKMKTKNRL